MKLLSLRTKKDAAEFSRDFYESYLFGPNSLGVNLVSTYAESVHRVTSEADPSFARVDVSKLEEELLGLQLEMIGTAWTHGTTETAALANSEFTKLYLAEIDRPDLWEVMGEYNQRVAASVTFGADSKSRLGRGKITFVNSMRISLCKKWEAMGHDLEALVRVANRFDSETNWNNGITPHLLGIRLMLRLDFESDAVVEPLATVAYGFYQGAKEALDGIKLIA